MKRQMATLLVSWLMIMALIAPFRVNAQCSAGDFDIYLQSEHYPSPDVTPYLQRRPEYLSCGGYWIASNTFTRLHQPSSSFQPSASGSCGYPYPNQCNNLRVLILGQTGIFGKMISVSPNVIDFVTPEIPTTASNYQVVVQKQISPGVWVASHTVQNVNLQEAHTSTFTEGNGSGKLIGSLYGYDGTYLKDLTNGLNQRYYAGQPTIVQLYFTGLKNTPSSIDVIYYVIGWPELLIVNIPNPIVSNPSTGVYVMNVNAPAGGWPIGDLYIGLQLEPTISTGGGIQFKNDLNQ